MIKVKKLSDKAVTPTKANPNDAGYDVYCIGVDKLKDGLFRCDIGLSMTCSEGHYIRVAPRSGLSAKFGYEIKAGVVDRSYTGRVVVVVYSPYGWIPQVGDKIAQLIETKIGDGLIEVEELDDTTRGSAGFGSSDLTSGYLSVNTGINEPSNTTLTVGTVNNTYKPATFRGVCPKCYGGYISTQGRCSICDMHK